MTTAAATAQQNRGWLPLLAFFLLCLGIGRMASLVTHDPMLGYANSYEMIRLQACHQIWPADKTIDITQGTPSAPLRRYTLDKHLDTPCINSTEQLLTGAAIRLATLKNHLTGEKLVSLKTIGAVRAALLSLTALLASLYFYRRQQQAALLANGLVMLVVLADPGVTLYFNTFYTEFSAVYCLYLALLGTVTVGSAVLAAGPVSPLVAMPLWLGLVGLGLSKPQHLPLALLLGALVSAWLVSQRRGALAASLLACALLPALLQMSGLFVQQNASMQMTDRVNFVGSLLDRTDNPAGLLNSLGLPDECRALKGKSGFDPAVMRHNPCPALDNLAQPTMLMALLEQPSLLASSLQQSLRLQKFWLQDRYGQVEGRPSGMAEHYQYSLGSMIRNLPDAAPAAILVACCLLPVLLLVAGRASRRPTAPCLFALLLALLQLGLLVLSLSKTGLAGPERYIPLYVPLAFACVLLLVTTLPVTLHGSRNLLSRE
jgi:hypothetical protein